MSVNIKTWNVEDEAFWTSTGKKIANKNLWISIPALLLAFSVWIMWGMLVTYMKDFGEMAYFVNIPSKFISEDGKVVHIRKSSKAESNHKEIYDALGLPQQLGKTLKAII